MNRLILIGAGGFGREVLAWASDAPEHGCAWEIAGFLDDDPHALDHRSLPLGILGNIEEHHPQPDERFLCAIAEPGTRRRVCEDLEARGAQFITLVHPTAWVGPRVTVGAGSILCPKTVATCDVSLGRHVVLNLSTAVGHDAVIGDFAVLSSFCDVTGKVTLGAEAFLGSGARILPGRHIGARARVGAGSVVIRDVREGESVFGNPAQRIAQPSEKPQDVRPRALEADLGRA